MKRQNLHPHRTVNGHARAIIEMLSCASGTNREGESRNLAKSCTCMQRLYHDVQEGVQQRAAEQLRLSQAARERQLRQNKAAGSRSGDVGTNAGAAPAGQPAQMALSAQPVNSTSPSGPESASNSQRSGSARPDPQSSSTALQHQSPDAAAQDHAARAPSPADPAAPASVKSASPGASAERSGLVLPATPDGSHALAHSAISCADGCRHPMSLRLLPTPLSFIAEWRRDSASRSARGCRPSQ